MILDESKTTGKITTEREAVGDACNFSFICLMLTKSKASKSF